MELALTITAILGIILFIVTYLKFVITGFKHHPVTGIISIFPVINLLVLPSLWYRSGRSLLVGFFGLLLVAGAWFLGAEKSMHGYLDLLMLKEQELLVTKAPIPSSAPLSIPAAKTKPESTPLPSTAAVKKSVSNAAVVDESELKNLPKKALYKMSFEAVPVKNLATLIGRIVRITDNNHVFFEGRIAKATASSVFIQLTGKQTADLELPIANIKTISLMVKKPL